jgi:hypothetical protein
MPSSGYTSGSFTAGQQPTTTIWNELWANDASFNSGAGFNDGILIARHFANNAVPGNGIAANALYLGSASATTNFSTSSTSAVAVTGLSVAATIPAGGRSVLILFCANDLYNSGSGTYACQLEFWKNGVGSGTRLQQMRPQTTGNPFSSPISGFALDIAPAAGVQTYTIALSTSNSASSANIDATATTPTQMVVLLI